MKKYSFPWYLRPDRDYRWYIAEKQRRTEDMFAADIDMNYAKSVSGRVYTSFSEIKHVSSFPFKIFESRPVYRVWDFGKTNCVVYAQIDSIGRKRIHLVRVLEGSTTGEQIEQAVNDSEDFFSGCHFYDIADPAGHVDYYGGGVPDIIQIEERFGVTVEGHTITEIRSTKRKKIAQQLITADLEKSANGEEFFKLYYASGVDDCSTLKKAFEGGYCYKKDYSGNLTDRIKEIHPHEDAMDCLNYLYLETSPDVRGKEPGSEMFEGITLRKSI